MFAAGQIASDYKTGVAPEARRNLEAVKLGNHREFSVPTSQGWIAGYRITMVSQRAYIMLSS
jgi:hypothetical protein